MWNSILKLLCHRVFSLALKMSIFWSASRLPNPLSYSSSEGSKRGMKVRINDSRIRSSL